MDFDLNAIMTDDKGRGRLRTTRDYELLEPFDSPVVGDPISKQGPNSVGGYWMRQFQVPGGASRQAIDEGENLPLLVRHTAEGITVVLHLDKVTHGHTPGEKNVDFVSAFGGDFPADCLPLPPLP